jgi:transposase InsO family protein
LDEEVVETMKGFGVTPNRASFRSPWQHGIAERWVGNCRRDLLAHVMVSNERHLKRLMSKYVRYDHDDRTHLSLKKETPASRAAVKNPAANGGVLSMPRLDGLHHRYDLPA